MMASSGRATSGREGSQAAARPATRSSSSASSSSARASQSSSSSKLPVGAEVATGSVAKPSRRGKLKDVSEAAESATTSSQGHGPEKTSIVKCAVCDDKIVDGKDEALFCEGRCQLWMHRYCAGVSRSQFKSLGTSTEMSYECATCFRESMAKRVQTLEDRVATILTEVSELQSVVKSFHQLQSELTSLTSEVAAVRDSRMRWSDVVGSGRQHDGDTGNAISKSHTKQQSSVEGLHHLSSECGSVVQEGSGIVGGWGRARERSSNGFGRGRGSNVFGGRGRGGGRQGRGGVSDVGWLGVNRRDQSGPGKQKRKFVKVSEAKKVWGTLRVTTALAVTNAISSIAKIPIDDMVVKRK